MEEEHIKIQSIEELYEKRDEILSLIHHNNEVIIELNGRVNKYKIKRSNEFVRRLPNENITIFTERKDNMEYIIKSLDSLIKKVHIEIRKKENENLELTEELRMINREIKAYPSGKVKKLTHSFINIKQKGTEVYDRYKINQRK